MRDEFEEGGTSKRSHKSRSLNNSFRIGEVPFRDLNTLTDKLDGAPENWVRGYVMPIGIPRQARPNVPFREGWE